MDYRSKAEPRQQLPDGAVVFCRFDKILPISQLIPNPQNPNEHGEEQVAVLGGIIKATGWRAPITVSRQSGMITKGHGRRLAALSAGLQYAPVEFQDYASPEEEKADLLADNRIAELANINEDKLSEMLKQMHANDENFPLELTGYDEDLLAGLLADEPDLDEADETDSEPEEDKPVVSAAGDLWLCGPHRVLCGDSTKPEDIARLMGDEKADLYITDPPYNVALGMGGSVDEARKRHRRTDGLCIMNDKMEDSDFRAFLVKAFSCAKSVMAPGAAFYIWHADNEGFNFRGALIDCGLKQRQTLIWNKNAITLGRQDYQWKHEPCLYGWNEGTHHWYGDRSQPTVIDMDKPTKSPDHPTMKPVGLFAYQITQSSKRGDIVLDSFGGSGTTMLACEQLGRKARLMELDPRYCDVIVRRYIEMTNDKNVVVIRGGEKLSVEEALQAAGTSL